MTARCPRPSSISSAVLPKAASPASSRPRSASTRSGCRRSNTRPCTTSASWRHSSDAVRQITAGTDCRYIVQLGDTGAHTHTSLKPQDEDRISASPFFDLLYGYHNRSREMTGDEITTTVASFATAAKRVADADCDGVEITASKGYLIHQFLNPFTNRRDDAYGGSIDGRFRFLEEIVRAVRQAVGPNSCSASGCRPRISTICRSTSAGRCSRCATISAATTCRRRPTTHAGWSSSASTISISTAASVSPIPRAARASIPTKASRTS